MSENDGVKPQQLWAVGKIQLRPEARNLSMLFEVAKQRKGSGEIGRPSWWHGSLCRAQPT